MPSDSGDEDTEAMRTIEQTPKRTHKKAEVVIGFSASSAIHLPRTQVPGSAVNSPVRECP
jgi:hypothetical protein